MVPEGQTRKPASVSSCARRGVQTAELVPIQEWRWLKRYWRILFIRPAAGAVSNRPKVESFCDVFLAV